MPATLKWEVTTGPDPTQLHTLSQSLGLVPAVIGLAMQRGYTTVEQLERFFHPRLKDLSDPFLLPGMDLAVPRILQAIDRGEKVVLYGDYDVDGVSSIALLHHVLRAYGLNTRCFLPTRLEEGYGLSIKGIENGLSGDPPDLLIAADCGTNSREEARLLRERGIDLIILDHHEPSSEGIAECVALVNPKLGDDFHYLCTAGVVFKIAHALLKTRPLPGFDLRQYLDLVALGTIADIVPLEGENRIFSRQGLAQLDRTIHPGLIALKTKAGVGVPSRSHDVGFKLGPRLNASGRLDTALASLDLLLCESEEESTALAESLDLQNRERQALELKTREEAEAMTAALSPAERQYAIVVGSRGWHPGVVGIVASRIAKKYHRPAFIISFDEDGAGKGSGRSIPGVSLVQALEAASPHITAGGGHEMAAGVSLHEDHLAAFRSAVSTYVEKSAEPEHLVPKLRIDAELGFEELTMELLDSYELLQPFGADNPAPLFMARHIHVVGTPRCIKEKHLKFRFTDGTVEKEAIYFHPAEMELPAPPWDIAFTIDPSEFRGVRRMNLILQAVRTAED